MLLTKHEGETFSNQTVYISGQAFIRCTFVGCTLVLREIKALVSMIEKAQEQHAKEIEGNKDHATTQRPSGGPFA